MAQFTLYENKDKTTRQTYPYFIDVQNALLSSLSTRIAIPLTPLEQLNDQAPVHLCPVILVKGNEFVLLTHQMASIPVSMLKHPVQDLGTHRDEIVGAIDFLVTGI